jgi:hypothetical protein
LGQTFHPGIYWAKKRFKQLKSFYKLGLDNHVGYFDCLQMILNEDGTISQNHGPYFLLQIKHFVHKVYEVEVVEKFTEVSL